MNRTGIKLTFGKEKVSRDMENDRASEGLTRQAS